MTLRHSVAKIEGENRLCRHSILPEGFQVALLFEIEVASNEPDQLKP